MDLKLLHTFLIAAEENNLTKTANKLGYAQSTITTHIKQLEDELQVTLFDRIGKSVFLSADGKSFLPYAKKIISLEKEMYNTFTNKPDFAPLSIGVSQSLSTSFAPSIIGKFQSQFPQTPLSISLHCSEELAALVAENELDIAICMRYDADRPELLQCELKKEPISFYAAFNHPLKNNPQLTLKEICSYPLVLTANNCHYHNMLIKYLTELQMPYHAMIESDNLHLLIQLAINGSGILFLPDIAVQSELADKKLIKLSVSDIKNFYSVSQILIHKQKHRNISMERFLQVAHEYF